jgi:hypothetical protein
VSKLQPWMMEDLKVSKVKQKIELSEGANGSYDFTSIWSFTSSPVLNNHSVSLLFTCLNSKSYKFKV